MQPQSQIKKSNRLPTFVIYLVCFLFAIGGMLVANRLFNNRPYGYGTIGDITRDKFSSFLADTIIVIFSIVIAKKLKASMSNNNEVTTKRVSAILLSMAGVLAALGSWVKTSDLYEPVVVLSSLGISVLAQIAFFFFISRFVFSSSDPVRKKVWTPIIFVLMFAVPSGILYAFATRL